MMGRFILDFYQPAARICIEVDGGYHFTQAQRKSDRIRDLALWREKGIRTLRITNEEAQDQLARARFLRQIDGYCATMLA